VVTDLSHSRDGFFNAGFHHSPRTVADSHDISSDFLLLAVSLLAFS
jgi:hypothetical protein